MTDKKDWKYYADKIARMAEEDGITEEQLLEALEKVSKEKYEEWKAKQDKQK